MCPGSFRAVALLLLPDGTHVKMESLDGGDSQNGLPARSLLLFCSALMLLTAALGERGSAMACGRVCSFLHRAGGRVGSMDQCPTVTLPDSQSKQKPFWAFLPAVMGGMSCLCLHVRALGSYSESP